MKRLVELRKRANLSQDRLSRIFNVGQTTISSWERGEKEPDCSTLIRLADYFNISVDYLLGRTNNPSPIKDLSPSPANVHHPDLTLEQQEKLRSYERFLIEESRQNE